MTPAYVAQLIDDLIALFDPVVQAVEDIDSAEALLKDMGYQPPTGIAFLNDFSAALEALVAVIDQTDTLLRGDTEPDYLDLFRALIIAIQDIVKLIRDIGSTLQQSFSADFLAATHLAEQFPRQLCDYLLVRMLERQHPLFHSLLLVVGCIDQGEVTTAATPFNTPYTKRVIRWEKLGDYFNSPLPSIQQAYGWNTDDFDYDGLIGNIHRFGQSVHLFSCIANPAPATLQALNAGVDVVTDANAGALSILKFPLLPVLGAAVGLEIYPVLNATNDKPVGLGLGFYFDPSGGLTFPLTDDLNLGIQYTGTTPLDIGIVILPGRSLQPVSNVFDGTGPQVDLSAFVPEFVYTSGDQKTLLFDSSFGAKLEVASWALRGGAFAKADGFYVECDLKGATLTISASQGDGFLQNLLPAQPMAENFDLTVGLSSKTGLYFGGSINLAVKLATEVHVGPITLEAITVAVKTANGGVQLTLGADISATLGPLNIVVENMGAAVTFSLPPNRDGNLGPLQADIGFKQPSGLGLAIDAAVVTGGGFLGFDPANSEYRGAAQLSIEGVGLSAFGLVQTQPKVSFLLLIGTTFPVPIELGFGFALAGAGGIVGINRTVALDALETAVWKGTAKNLLFPSAPITNAATILGTLDTLFPAAPGRYLFGPTGRITWGEPAIVTANIGLVMELPEPIRIAVFGNAVAQFPLKNPIIVLQVSFAGGVDFGSERLFFDASLSGSRIERYPISGDMSLRSSLSSPKNLALAVGGFNPHFQPPAGFPTLSRLALDISDGPLHLHLAAYLAITTNTFQIGAAIDLKAHVCDCDLAGHFAFDALFVKNPFSFEIDIDASASIAFEGDTFAGIHVSGSLAGPAPWHAKGSASISLLFFSVGVDFDHSWGSPPPPTLPPVDPWTTALAPALADPTSWKLVLPPGVHPVVTLAPATGSGPMLLDPAGEIILDQKAVPLNQSIDCFADTVLATPLRFDLAALAVNGAELDAADWIKVTDEFAPAQFSTMTDDEKLSAESFVALVSGMAIGGTAASVGASVSASLTYDQIILDSTRKAGPRLPYLLPLALQIASAASGPSARAPWRTSGLGRFAAAPGTTPKAALAPAAFAIASTATLGIAQAAVASTRYTAALALKDYVAQHSVAPQSVEAVQARAA